MANLNPQLGGKDEALICPLSILYIPPPFLLMISTIYHLASFYHQVLDSKIRNEVHNASYQTHYSKKGKKKTVKCKFMGLEA